MRRLLSLLTYNLFRGSLTNLFGSSGSSWCSCLNNCINYYRMHFLHILHIALSSVLLNEECIIYVGFPKIREYLFNFPKVHPLGYLLQVEESSGNILYMHYGCL
jgi:hypothetical protein